MKQSASIKHRAHRALFDDTLPFKPKREELKTSFRRHPKHKGKEIQ